MNWFFSRLAEGSSAAGLTGAIMSVGTWASGAVDWQVGLGGLLASVLAFIAPDRGNGGARQ